MDIEEKNIYSYELESIIVECQSNMLYTKEQTNKLYNLNNTYIQIKNRIFNDLFVYLLPVLELEKIHQSHEK